MYKSLFSAVFFGVAIIAASGLPGFAQSKRVLQGTVVTPQFEFVPGVNIEVDSAGKKLNTVSDGEGRFSIEVPDGPLVVIFSGKNIAPTKLELSAADPVTEVQAKISYRITPLVESVTIVGDALTPEIEYRNGAVYSNNLFGRDDQIIQTLNAGINAGQHEGGGKSLEIRRYGFNTDHGGVNGGVKIVVDNVQQNQGTQGHGQGYLGALKSLSPELVEDVSIINGPFSAAYGDFSGLGVVQIMQRESLPDVLTARFQGGAFNTFRGFFAASPKVGRLNSFFAYEPSYTDGPFINPLKYRRDNVSGNLIFDRTEHQAFGLRFNFGRNNFTSSGQIPLDLVANGELDRFGFIDPENGGRVKHGTATFYFRNEFNSGATVKADAFVSRSLFDLYSNFTFFAFDPVYGDEIQQHDSRLQQGANLQVFQPYKIGNVASLLTVGGGFLANQINVGLYPAVGRAPSRKFLPGNMTNPDVLFTTALADVNNYSGYVQNSMAFLDGRLRLDLGLRYDRFSFKVDGFELSDTRTDLIGKQSDGKFQPKASLALSPFKHTPFTFYVNYGRGISSQDARGVIREPSSPKIATTDFYQTGVSYNGSRFSAVVSGFLIDRSNEQVYIPDDGSIELAGPSRSYGIEVRNSIRFTRHLSFNGGLTKVVNSFFRGQFTATGSRVVIDSAPRFVSNAGFVLADLRGFISSLTWRHVSNYRLDGEDPDIRAAGNDVVDLSVTKRLRSWLDLNLAVDNVFNKRYFETQNLFESRTCSMCDPRERIHATPGYPFTVTAGMTFRFGAKN